MGGLVSALPLPVVDELEALERALDTYRDQYLCLIGASAMARHYVREQLKGGTWALRADVLGAQRWQEACQILHGTGMGGEFVLQARGLEHPWRPRNPEAMVRALVVTCIRTHGELSRV